jgi:sterol desaturase/sphingolipid hydroxylase (fatty acid hydroxylase superfamily)
VLGLVLQRFLAPISALIAAETARRSGIGLLNSLGPNDGWAFTLAGVAALDLWRYFEHRAIHAVPLLWRLHLTHHSDIETDFTTTERHHPLETIFGSLSIVLGVALLGVSPLAISFYVVLASAVALFSHANIRLPERLERALGVLIVTPGVHNVHHSAMRSETDSNYGTLSPVWDRMLGTYRAPDRAREAARIVGLEYFRDAESARLDRVLCQPFRSLRATSDVDVDVDRLPAG